MNKSEVCKKVVNPLENNCLCYNVGVIIILKGFSDVSDGKESACRRPGWRIYPGEGNATHSNTFVWRIS